MTEKIHYKPGLKDNWVQFSLLVLINAFVGGMVGMERTILPEIAETDFGIAARSAIFSFIVVFGITKAVSNYFAGRFAQQFGRKKMLIVGWLFGLPVPFMLMYAPDWNWIIAANLFLGINQGLAWSATDDLEKNIRLIFQALCHVDQSLDIVSQPNIAGVLDNKFSG